MPDALMQWDEKQKRWRAMYRRIRLQVRASVLVAGATTRDATIGAANRWLNEQKACIDRELTVGTHRPNEEDYLDELKSIQSAIKALPVVARSNPALETTLAQEVDKLKHREALIRKALRQEILPPLDDTLRNPINVSPARIEADATQEAAQQIANRLRDKDRFTISNKELENYDDFVPDDAIGVDDYFDGEQYNLSAYSHGMRHIEQHNEELKAEVQEERIQAEAEHTAVLKDGLVAQKKKEQGLIEDEHLRGRLEQMVKEHGANVPENKQLEYHLGKFVEDQHADVP